MICKLCKERGKERTYEGETCKNTCIRGNKHMEEYEKKSRTSVMYKHLRTEHENQEENLKLRPAGRSKGVL